MPPSPTDGPSLFTRRPSRKARSLTPLAGLLGVVLITNALIGLFGLYYAHQGTVANFAEMNSLMVDLDAARRARGDFKVQVQEWKNILLRHNEPGGLERYWDGFRARESETRRTLEAMAERIQARGGDPAAIRTILEHHAALGKAYRAALAEGEKARATSGGGFDAQVADARVRGMDRTLDGELDNLALKVFANAKDRQQDMIVAGQARYETLRATATWGLGGCILLVGLFLALAVRGDRTKR
ncbi:hypothetical protein [Rhodospirillum sp. A1_3_36]|uniref:hypothetical protein n=1 Tax=Rhodospirillum sp. A1_3_36 TaxID=3391666 RepID=UPI0039A649B4